MKNPRLLAAAPLLVLFALLGSACVRIENPQGWAQPTFDGSTVYFPKAKDKLSAFELNPDGSLTQLWQFPDTNREDEKDVKLQAIYGAAIKDADRIYFASFAGGVFALDAKTGRAIWPGKAGDKSQISGNISGGVALAGDKLLFGTTQGLLYAWNTSDGSPAKGWEKPKKVDGGIWATPIISGDTIFVATMDGQIQALSLADGTPRWPAPFKASGSIADLTLLDGGRLFVPSLNRHVYILDAASGAVQTDFRADDWVWTSPTVKDNLAYFGDFSGKTYALDISATPASQLWSSDAALGARVKAGPAIVDDVLIVADRDSIVHFLDAKTGTGLNKVPLGGDGTIRANVVAKDGFAYVVTTSGKLYKADPKAKQVVEVPIAGALK